VKSAIDSGSIGDVVEFRSEIARYRPDVRERWRERPGPGAGLWYDLGPHLIDQALLLFGIPDTVYADLRTLRRGGAVDDWFIAHLTYKNLSAILCSSMLAAEPGTRFIVRGTTGAVVKRKADVQEDQLLKGMQPGSPGWGHDPDSLLLFRSGGEPNELAAIPGNYLNYYARVRDAITRNGQMPVTPTQASTVIAILEAGFRSSQQHTAIVPDLSNDERMAWPTTSTPQPPAGAKA